MAVEGGEAEDLSDDPEGDSARTGTSEQRTTSRFTSGGWNLPQVVEW